MTYLFLDYLRERLDGNRGDPNSKTTQAARALAQPWPTEQDVRSQKALSETLYVRGALQHFDNITTNAHTLWGGYMHAKACREGRPYKRNTSYGGTVAR